MSTTNITEPVFDKSGLQAANTPPGAADRYTRADIIANARGLGYTPETLAGAFSLDSRADYSIDEVSTAVSNFLHGRTR
jgi:hypothetical protein